MRSMNRKCSDFSGGPSLPALSRLRVARLMGVLILAFSLSACSYVRSAVSYAQKAVDYAQNTANRVLTDEAYDAAGIEKARDAAKTEEVYVAAKTEKTPDVAKTEEAYDAAEEISETNEIPKPMVNVVLHSAPRHLMVKPRTDPVWLWDKPGGFGSRAVRIRKVPSGTPGKVVETEPISFTIWDAFNFKNVARQPIRWMKVATLLGVGWVRVDFIELR